MEDTEIEGGKYGYVEYPRTISTCGIGPCIGIGIYDRKTRKGYLIHEDSCCDENVEDFIALVLKNSKTEDLDIKVSGAGIYSDDIDREGPEQSKYQIEKIMSERFPNSHLKYCWPEIDCDTEIMVITEKAKIKIVFSKNGEYIKEDC